MNASPSSIIIPHYNGLQQLTECVDSLLTSDANRAEIIVVDNASLDSCSEVLEKDYPDVRFIRSSKNRGTAGGWNLGARRATREYLAFLNDDIVVPRRWLTPMLDSLQDPSVGCVCSLCIFAQSPSAINSAGGVCDFLGFAHNRGLGTLREDYPQAVQEPAFYAVGTAMAIRRDTWEEMGGFDEAFFMYGDDLDWSWRVRLAGYKVVVEPDAVVQHRWRGSGLPLERTIYLLERNQLRCLLKNYSSSTLILLAPVWALVKMARLMWLAIRRREFAFRTAEAWLWNAENLEDTLQERRRVQAHRRVADRKVMLDMVYHSLELRLGLGKGHHPLASQLGVGPDSNEGRLPP